MVVVFSIRVLVLDHIMLKPMDTVARLLADWHPSNTAVSCRSERESEFGSSFHLLRTPTPSFGCRECRATGGIPSGSEWVAPFVFSTKWNQLRRSTKSKAEAQRGEVQMNGGHE